MDQYDRFTGVNQIQQAKKGASRPNHAIAPCKSVARQWTPPSVSSIFAAPTSTKMLGSNNVCVARILRHIAHGSPPSQAEAQSNKRNKCKVPDMQSKLRGPAPHDRWKRGHIVFVCALSSRGSAFLGQNTQQVKHTNENYTTYPLVWKKIKITRNSGGHNQPNQTRTNQTRTAPKGNTNRKMDNFLQCGIFKYFV